MEEAFTFLHFLCMVLLITGLFKPGLALFFMPEHKRTSKDVIFVYGLAIVGMTLAAFLVIPAETALFFIVMPLMIAVVIGFFRPGRVLPFLAENKRKRKSVFVYLAGPLVVLLFNRRVNRTGCRI
ncbi:hypothetical protein [Alteribacter natronophilus]|uniref:hypothetical protein n=1 Tax=Alteribacter natronophilus TaxID=2583810 RepID=UPI00110EF5FF|nr:hypothetical protein [Alteribacter natronophilus]TMW72271.1 hypothetical protein FGB90_08655 [Alteribacter natronophilus]